MQAEAHAAPLCFPSLEASVRVLVCECKYVCVCVCELVYIHLHHWGLKLTNQHIWVYLQRLILFCMWSFQWEAQKRMAWYHHVRLHRVPVATLPASADRAHFRQCLWFHQMCRGMFQKRHRNSSHSATLKNMRQVCAMEAGSSCTEQIEPGRQSDTGTA